jgi:pyruvate/2-oxoglutarate dehydrogenase complex dihydrolipoamide acyltransferase (E2) component
MSETVKMPALGESVTEGTVTRWLKAVGETVEVDEPLLEVSTDKVDTEIPSPVAGTIEKILVEEDEDAEVGADLVVIGDGSGSADAGSNDSGAEAPAEEEQGEDLASDETRRAVHRAGGARRRARAGHCLRRLRRGRGGDDAGARRVRHRGHRHPLAQGRRRDRRGRRAAARGLDRQGRHRDPLARRGHRARDPRPGGRGRRGRLRAGDRRLRRCSGPEGRRARRSGAEGRGEARRGPEAGGTQGRGPEAGGAQERGAGAGGPEVRSRPVEPGPAGRGLGLRRGVLRLRHPAGAEDGRRGRCGPVHREGLGPGRSDPQAGRAAGDRRAEGPGRSRRRSCTGGRRRSGRAEGRGLLAARHRGEDAPHPQGHRPADDGVPARHGAADHRGRGRRDPHREAACSGEGRLRRS